MANSQESNGPDFGQGIDAKQLGEGQMLAGQVGGEAVLLARSGAEVFAVGGQCTHYGAPLADGLLVGTTVRCPYHHACFSLETGAALRAPARDGLSCYEVEQRDGKLFVLGKRTPSAVTTPTSAPDSIVIVGGGAAGNSAAEKLRREGYAGSLTLVGEEDSLPVDRPNLSKDYLAGTAPEEWIPLRSVDFYLEQRIDCKKGRVTAIDVSAKRVTLADGSTIGYGALLLATGASVNRPSLPGAEMPHALTLRTLADSRAIIAACATAKRVVVTGAGFIGLEVAASLRKREIDVTIVAPDAVPLERVLGSELGHAILRLHEQHGVHFALKSRPKAVTADRVILEDGRELEADLVVFGIGVHPEIALAQAAGLRVDRGIVVDEHLQTSAPGVYAAGDCARFPDPVTGAPIRVEHWVVATRQGEVAALNLLGKKEPYRAIPFFWSAHYDCTVSYLGHAESWDRIDIAGSVEELDCAVAFRKGDRTLALATLGRDRASLEAELAMEQGDEATLRRLVPRGLGL